MKYPALILGLSLLAAAPAPQATPLPTPPPLNDATPVSSPAPSPTPAATATPSLDDIFGGRHKGRGKGPEATPTPPVDTRVGLDGVWEIEIQRGPKTQYEHMKLVQTGTMLTGYYLTQDKVKYPIQGELDADHAVRLIVTRPDGTTILLEGRVDGTTDMLGMFTDSKERVPFTAAYRPKEKFIDNVNAGPGGLGGIGGGGGP